MLKCGTQEEEDSDGIKIVFHDHTTEEGEVPTNPQFLALFEKGNVAFHTGSETGVKITYTDKNLVEWSSGVPVEGDVFKFTNIRKSTSSGIAKVEFEAEFSCKVYNTSGTSKMLKNCQIKHSFENLHQPAD